jgi:hypothetical protein
MSTKSRRILKEGLVAGLIGFAAVAIVFAVVNLGAGRSPLYSAAVLGEALFYDVSEPDLVSVKPGAVLAYSVLHLAVFVAFGVLAAALATLADRGWQLWFVALFFFVFFSFHMVAAVQGLAAPMRSLLSGPMIWGAGLAASFLMAGYLVRAHPRLRAAQSW